MSVQVRLPSALRTYADGAAIVEVPPSDVGGALASVVARHERLRAHLFDDLGHLRGFVGLYLNQKDVKTLQREATPTRAGDVLIVLPSVAGG
jgi:molybdopterin converting factor small subunit